MTDSADITKDPLFQALIEEAKKAPRDKWLKAMLLFTTNGGFDLPKSKSDQPKRKVNQEGQDEILGRYSESFRRLTQIHQEEFNGYATIKQIYEAADKYSLPPFRTWGLEKSIPLIARHFTRFKRRLEPAGTTASTATADTEIWTTPRWAEHCGPILGVVK